MSQISTPNRRTHPNRHETPHPLRIEPYRFGYDPLVRWPTASREQQIRGWRRIQAEAERRRQRGFGRAMSRLRAEEVWGAA